MIDKSIEWSFKKDGLSEIQKYAAYPAVMVAPMQRIIIDEIILNHKVITALDPFCGSGTTMVELRSKVEQAYAFDINPYAILHTQVKSKGVTKTIENDINTLESIITNYSITYTIWYKNITKWFNVDIIYDLSILNYAIKQIKSKHNRRFFWLTLGEVARIHSNSRTSTFKLHIENYDKIASKKNKVFDLFFMKVRKGAKIFQVSATKTKYNIKLCDTEKELAKFNDRSIDLIVTSPPYGDNKTTVTYGQFSTLPLLFIDRNDLEYFENSFDNYSSIDSMSLGSKNKIKNIDIEKYTFLKEYINGMSSAKRVKVLNFFIDYFSVLDSLERICNKYIIMTLGNRTVDGININLTNITKNYLESKGMILENEYLRDIPSKRIPKKISNVNGAAVKSMNTEFVIIMKKY